MTTTITPAALTVATPLEAARVRSAQIEADLAVNPGDYRMLSGDRPTGGLHLGHLIGSLANRVRLQEMGVPTTILIADYQVITDREHIGPVGDRVLQLVAEYLAIGIDPQRTVIFPHSAVPDLNQLMLPFLSLVTEAELHRNPTVKAELAASGRGLSGLLLTYPVHQAADILAVRGNLVPVGQDQLPHLELTRTIARRFNERYGPVFAEPDALLSEGSLVLGTDGTKMSKSRGNAIALGDTEDRTRELIRRARTDSERRITFEPQRRPEVASLLTIGAFTSGVPEVRLAEEIGDGGAARLKAFVVDSVNAYLCPVRARRAELIADPGHLREVLADGIVQARAVAGEVLREVRQAMGTDYLLAG